MEQIKLGNGNLYELVTNGIFELEGDKVQVSIRSGGKTFEEIEQDFGVESNVQKLSILDSSNETMSIEKNYTHLESIAKHSNYVVGSEKSVGVDGEVTYQAVTDTVYTIILSKPDLRQQIKTLQETVDVLILEGLGV